jgi:hypothetical protein
MLAAAIADGDDDDGGGGSGSRRQHTKHIHTSRLVEGFKSL